MRSAAPPIVYSGSSCVYGRHRVGGLPPPFRAFDDLDAHPHFVLKRGHIEKDGGVVIAARTSDVEAIGPVSTSGQLLDCDGDAPRIPHPDGR